MAEQQTESGGVLFVVATPIGNLRDLTVRALEVLAAADLIACEDTRRTAILLAAHSLSKPLVSYFEHNEERRAQELVERLRLGAKIALVSDAGTPTISDPGYRLVKAALEAGCRVVAVPGPSAVVAAVSVSGLPTDRYAFEGFLPPRSAARRQRLRQLRHDPRTLVFFEAARRLADTVADLAAEFGADRPAAIVRELTKLFEETIRGPLGELAAHLREVTVKGEVTLVVGGASDTSPREAGITGLSVEMLVEAGLGLRQASELIARLQGGSRRSVYQQALDRRRQRGVEPQKD